MKNGKYIIKFSKQADKDKIKLKNSGSDKNARMILNLMIDDPFSYPQNYEKLTGDLTGYIQEELIHSIELFLKRIKMKYI